MHAKKRCAVNWGGKAQTPSEPVHRRHTRQILFVQTRTPLCTTPHGLQTRLRLNSRLVRPCLIVQAGVPLLGWRFNLPGDATDDMTAKDGYPAEQASQKAD